MDQAVSIQQLRRDEYDSAAVAFPLPPFLESAWVEALAKTGHRPAYFGFNAGSQRVGLGAGLEVCSRWRVLSGVSRHLYLYGMPVVDPTNAITVMDHFKSHLQRLGFNTLEIAYYYNPPPQVAGLPGFKTRRTEEYRLDLSPPLPEIQRGLNRLRRRLINRANQNHLLYEESQGAARLNDLLACLGQTKERRTERGVGRYSYYYIPGLDDTVVRRLLVSGIARICTVSREGRLLSAGLVVRNRRYAYYLLAGATKEGYDLGASTYMQWCVIEQSKTAGCTTLNLGGVPKDQSSAQLVEFKTSFGAEAQACEGGSCYLRGGWHKLLHRSYKFSANPWHYLQVAAQAFRQRNRTSKRTSLQPSAGLEAETAQ